ncbi:MAG: hypothetical protein ACFCVK_15360 [Acidimicrobiales bacterium]
MIELDASSVLLQWATGGLFFLWVTGRRRLVGVGYGWLLRSTYGLLALGAFVIGLRLDSVPGRDLPALGVAVATAAAGLLSYRRRAAGVAGPRARAAAARERVGAMVAPASAPAADDAVGGDAPSSAEFDPRLDLVAPAIGLVGLVMAGIHAGDPLWLSVARMVVGAAFLGAVSDAMLLGHWYLVQPGLNRAPLVELVRWTGVLWLPEVALLLVPTGMVSVWTGAIDDGYAGMLGWFWGACVVTTIGLVGVTLAALRERQYAAVMAATGLLYLAILTGFGIDLVGRASLG